MKASATAMEFNQGQSIIEISCGGAPATGYLATCTRQQATCNLQLAASPLSIAVGVVRCKYENATAALAAAKNRFSLTILKAAH